MPKVVVFGGSFNPPGLHHRQIAEYLATMPGEELTFDRVHIVPCGPRPEPEKDAIDDIDPKDRAMMIDLNFSDLPSNAFVHLFDLWGKSFTPTRDLDTKFALAGRNEVWQFVGSDLFVDEEGQPGAIYREWLDGKTLWKRLNFVFMWRNMDSEKRYILPPHHYKINHSIPGSSKEIRNMIAAGKKPAGLIPAVWEYIQQHGLYRPTDKRR